MDTGIDTKTECRCVVGGRIDGHALRVDEMPLSENYKMCIFIGLLLGIGLLHTSYIILTTKRDNEAIERSWRARINGWVFKQQYVTPAVSEGDWDRGFEMEVM